MWKTLFLIGAGIALVHGNCTPCPAPPLIYTELNCTGILRQGDCCALAYSCPSLSAQDPAKCHFRGQTYEPGAMLDETSSCLPPCICQSKQANEPPSWTCTHIDCPEYLGGGPNLRPGCKFSYNLNQCCASQTEQVCEADRPTLHKCLYRGAEYVKGEKFYPRDNPCFQCTCDENFRDHQVHQPNCRKYACHYETIYKDKILDNCAPVYGETECCAIDWICPKDLPNPKTVPWHSVSTLDGCKFGSLDVKHLEGIETNNKCRKCTCKMPPYLTCTQEPGCVN